MPLTEMRFPIQGLTPHASHQGGDLASPNDPALVPEEITQHPRPSKGILQMQLVDPPHHCQRRLGDRHRLVIRRRASQLQQLALPYNWQGMRAIDHRFTLSKPALLSAPSKKSFSSASCPILACRVLRSGVSAVGLVPPKTSAARANNCYFHSVICVGWTLKCSANSVSVLSPLMAATATCALKVAP
jgi:hypothetical protein